MKIEVTDHSPVKKSMSVEVGPEVVESETERVLQRYSHHARIPGFREGKAPKSMIRKRFAKEIEDDVREALVGKLYGDAARERGFRPLGDPTLDGVDHSQRTVDVVAELAQQSVVAAEILLDPLKSVVMDAVAPKHRMKRVARGQQFERLVEEVEVAHPPGDLSEIQPVDVILLEVGDHLGRSRPL